jgi:hypothetical protein
VQIGIDVLAVVVGMFCVGPCCLGDGYVYVMYWLVWGVEMPMTVKLRLMCNRGEVLME